MKIDKVKDPLVNVGDCSPRTVVRIQAGDEYIVVGKHTSMLKDWVSDDPGKVVLLNVSGGLVWLAADARVTIIGELSS